MNMPPVVIESAKYIWDKYPAAQGWTWPIALSWVHWHMSMGYMAIARDNPVDHNIIGVAVIRPVNKPGDGAIAYEHDENGQCLFIDLFACDNRLAFALLTFAFAQRFGARKNVAYFRGAESALRVKEYDQFKRRVGGRLEETPYMETE
jgi:hypothetical protein